MSRPIFRGIVLTLGGLLAPARSQAAEQPAPVHMIVTVEARNGAGLPSLKEGDVIAYQGHERLRVTGLTACQGKNAAMELFLVLDDASSPSAGPRSPWSCGSEVRLRIGHAHQKLVQR